MNLAPLPIQKFFDNNGNPMNGGLLFTYVAGTTTKIATYTDSTGGTSNANPIVLDFRGECRIWLDQTLTYKFTLAPPGDTDPPTKPIWTVDNISAAVTFASLTASIIGLILYPRTANEVSAGVTPTNYQYPEFNFLRYGADRTGVASSNTAQAQMMAVLTASSYGADIDVPYGTYLFQTQATWTPKDATRTRINAFGAVFKSSGAISTFKVSGGTTNGGFSVYGLQVDNHGDVNCIAGYEIVGTSRTRFYECHLRPGGNSATYTQWLWRNSDPADPNTGSYWGLMSDCSARRLTGGDGALPNFGVTFHGAANACQIRGGEMGDAATVVRIEPEAGQTPASNGILLNGVAFENFTTAVLLTGLAATEIGGFRSIGCRFEPSGAATMFSFTGSTTQAVVTPFMVGSYLTPDVTNYLNNPNSLRYRSLDDCSNPQVRPQLQNYRALLVSAAQAGQHGLIVQPPEAGKGLVVTDNAGAAAGMLVWEGNDNKARLNSTDVGEMGLTCIRGISSSGTDAKNLAGNDAFVGAALTRTITFANNEPDASFKVMIMPTSDWGAQTKPPWVTAPSTTGFTVNAQATTGGGTFNWFIVRV